MKNLLPRSIVIFVAVVSALVQPLFSQSADNVSVKVSEPKLIDEFGRLGECDFGARIDGFLVSLHDNPSAHGVVLLYNGYDVLPAQYEHPLHERLILNHILFRRYDRARITLVNGGFREKMTTELWLVPPGAEFPVPTNVMPDPAPFANGTYKYDSKYLGLDYEGIPNEYVLPEALEKKQKEQEALWGDEDPESTDTSEPDEPIGPETQAENERDAAEALERFKTYWVSVVFAKHLYKNPGDLGVLIFYADDEYYDVSKLRGLIDEQMANLAKDEKVEPSRFKVIFGGYRDSPVVEYWVVPSGGSDPVPVPDERTEECEDDCVEP